MTNQIPQTDINHAVALFQAGQLVAFPTDTVYGLGADASNPAAIAQLYRVKQRPLDRPIALLLADSSQLKEWVTEINPIAQQLAEHFWPGPLTLVLPRAAHIPAIMVGGQSTVGVRVPNHPLTQQLLTAFGGALAVTSANRSGASSLTSATTVRQELGNDVALVLESPHAMLGIESTVIEVSGEQPQLVRLGAISMAQINAVLGIL